MLCIYLQNVAFIKHSVFLLFLESLIEKRGSYIDLVAHKPHLPDQTQFQGLNPSSSSTEEISHQNLTVSSNGVFPLLPEDILNTEPKNQK